MSESGSKSSQPLASKQEKDGTEKRGRGRPRKQPPSPVKCQLRRDLGADQREARIRAPPRPGKSPQLQGGNQGADPRNWRRRKRRASPRSPLRRSSDHHSQCRLLHSH
ncbi:high mobility group protein HMG-I/HMG-Y isoform h [Mus musculus]|uniref:high mobility group protein HMG-I/HMG-Y isoform h n=1 Tax=Mus musculus TaxID=10090 RepID=UPI0021E459E5|nr:high mobility group protein HMG-I/HMG-Y isoform h [Mus musculus]NP_001399683.1 high mobility group protein HMG-I/HMG-Y isoform h [Mus musculus]NP_001399684.1 high mobility group protein HMG-I/HMG-Y isoform h [Mus musculus]NP_001399693.1 high mobility group protein HMG-I/HMG-Y isoform h [Mus musculus]